MYSRKSHRREP
ncbi:hypothetical protein YPPY32_3435, partial [Yersinia pestis PY-32]